MSRRRSPDAPPHDYGESYADVVVPSYSLEDPATVISKHAASFNFSSNPTMHTSPDTIGCQTSMRT